MPHRVGRNEPCPCGSGKKYKACCYRKSFDYVQNDDGSVDRVVPISDELAQLLEGQQERFRQVHGREPGPEDRVFFDAPSAEVVEHQMVEIMREAGFDPAKIHAFIETGLIPVEGNLDAIPSAALDRWHDAVDDYESSHGASLPMPPWPKSEWKKLRVTDLGKSKKFWKYFERLQEEFFSDSERTRRCLTLIESFLVTNESTDWTSLSPEEVRRLAGELVLERDLLCKALTMVVCIKPGEDLAYVQTFELALFAADFVHHAQVSIQLEDDAELNALLEQVRSLALMSLILAINAQFGMVD